MKRKQMTQSKKLKHTESLKTIVESYGFKADKFDNYFNKKRDIRIKFNNIRLLIQAKGFYGWMELMSKSIVKVDKTKLNNYLKFNLS